MMERNYSGVIVGGGSRINAFADALDRELSFSSLRAKRVGVYEWKLRMGLGVKGSLRLSRVYDDLHYEFSLGLSRIPLALSLLIAVASITVSLLFFLFGFIFFLFLFPLVVGFWNIEKAESEIWSALEAAQFYVFGTVKYSPLKKRACPLCGFEPPEWAIYCPNCGTKL
ncbi:MAG: zinc ribbon domain-containing protein [Candidatus Jordarchaeales archaeon]